MSLNIALSKISNVLNQQILTKYVSFFSLSLPFEKKEFLVQNSSFSLSTKLSALLVETKFLFI